MKITDLINENTIILNLNATNREEIIDELSQALYDDGKVSDLGLFREDIWNRENQVSTEVGLEIAMPHAKSAAVETPSVAIGRNSDGIVYDQESCKLFVMIAAKKDGTDDHLNTIAKLSRMLISADFREDLLQSADEKELISLISEKEAGMN